MNVQCLQIKDTTSSKNVHIKISLDPNSPYTGPLTKQKMGTRPNNFHLFNEEVKYKYMDVKLQFQFTPYI